MKRISGYISDELYLEIKSIAEKEDRKITPMIDILLRRAVKEIQRKRNAKQKNSIEHHSADMG